MAERITLENGDAFDFPEPGQQLTEDLVNLLLAAGGYVMNRYHIGGSTDAYIVEPAPDSDVPPVRLGLEERTGAWVRL